MLRGMALTNIHCYNIIIVRGRKGVFAEIASSQEEHYIPSVELQLIRALVTSRVLFSVPLS